MVMSTRSAARVPGSGASPQPTTNKSVMGNIPRMQRVRDTAEIRAAEGIIGLMAGHDSGYRQDQGVFSGASSMLGLRESTRARDGTGCADGRAPEEEGRGDGTVGEQEDEIEEDVHEEGSVGDAPSCGVHGTDMDMAAYLEVRQFMKAAMDTSAGSAQSVSGSTGSSCRGHTDVESFGSFSPKSKGPAERGREQDEEKGDDEDYTRCQKRARDVSWYEGYSRDMVKKAKAKVDSLQGESREAKARRRASKSLLYAQKRFEYPAASKRKRRRLFYVQQHGH